MFYKPDPLFENHRLSRRDAGYLCRERITPIALNATRDYRADLWAIINKLGGESFHPLFLSKQCSYKTANIRLSPGITRDVLCVQSLTDKSKTDYIKFLSTRCV